MADKNSEKITRQPKLIVQQFILDLKQAIESNDTAFISKKCSYEKGLECLLNNENYICQSSHHHDFLIYGIKVEIKKSSGNFWIPEVRMAELFLKPELLKHHYTLFIKTRKIKNKTVIHNLGIVRTKYFLADLQFDQAYCQSILDRERKLREKVRRLHSQQSYNWKDVLSLSKVIIASVDSLSMSPLKIAG